MTDPAGALQRGTAASVGLAQEVLERASGVVAKAVEDGQIGASTLTVGRRNRLVHQAAFGPQTPEADALETAVGPVFLLASNTKPVTGAPSSGHSF